MFREYASRLVKAGCEVRVVTSNSGGVEGKASYDGVDTFHFRWPSLFGHPVPRSRDLLEFAEWSDVVHTATYTAAPVALSVSKRLNRPCIVTVYESLGDKWFWIQKNILKSVVFYLFEHFVINKRYSKLHAISLATQNDLLKQGISKDLITTIYPGISERFRCRQKATNDGDLSPPSLATDKSLRVFLYFGRPGKTKGIFVLLEAIRRVRNKLPAGFRFVFILGEEPIGENQRLKDLVSKYELHHIVEIMKPLAQESLIRVISDAFCVVIPSITEGFGYTAAESCSLGKPVIVSDAGSLPEVAFGKVLFFQNRNSQDLSEKILMATRNEFIEIPEKVFDWDASTRELLATYRTLV